MKRLIFILLVAYLPTIASAQEVYRSSGNRNVKRTESKKGFDASRLVYGGGVGLMFGNYTFISLHPKVGYRVMDRLAVGIGTGFTYENAIDYYGPGRPYRATMFSPSAWAWYTPIDQIFLNTEYVYNMATVRQYRYNSSGSIEPYKVPITIPQWWLGGGYRQPLTSNASMYIGLYYNLLNKSNNPGNGIDVRMGIMLGI